MRVLTALLLVVSMNCYAPIDFLKIGPHLWAIYIGMSLVYVAPKDIGVTELIDIKHIADVSIFTVFTAVTEIGEKMFMINSQNQRVSILFIPVVNP